MNLKSQLQGSGKDPREAHSDPAPTRMQRPAGSNDEVSQSRSKNRPRGQRVLLRFLPLCRPISLHTLGLCLTLRRTPRFALRD
jgi:hypothetical protein